MNKSEKYIEFRAIFKNVITVLSWTFFSLLLIIGAFLLYYVISTNIYASRGEQFKPPFSLYTIVSGSMEPKIKVYDVILNINADKIKIEKGDIITFVSSSPLTNGMIVTHRVIDIIEKDGSTFYRTKGDNNKTPDTGLQSRESILGKTILKVPQLGRIQFFLASRGGWIFAIVIPAVGIIIYDMMKIGKLVGVKNKIDNVTKKEPPKKDSQKLEKEKLIKEELKRKHLLFEELPALKKVESPPEDLNEIEIDISNNNSKEFHKKEELLDLTDIININAIKPTNQETDIEKELNNTTINIDSLDGEEKEKSKFDQN